MIIVSGSILPQHALQHTSNSASYHTSRRAYRIRHTRHAYHVKLMVLWPVHECFLVVHFIFAHTIWKWTWGRGSEKWDIEFFFAKVLMLPSKSLASSRNRWPKVGRDWNWKFSSYISLWWWLVKWKFLLNASSVILEICVGQHEHTSRTRWSKSCERKI